MIKDKKLLDMMKKLPDDDSDDLGMKAKKMALGNIKKDMVGREGKRFFPEEPEAEVTIASDSPEGLEEGLDVASEMMSSEDEGEDMQEILDQLGELDEADLDMLMEEISKRKMEKQAE